MHLGLVHTRAASFCILLFCVLRTSADANRPCLNVTWTYSTFLPHAGIQIIIDESLLSASTLHIGAYWNPDHRKYHDPAYQIEYRRTSTH